MRHTLKSVIKSFDVKADEASMSFYFFFRPLSFCAAYAALRLKITANQASLVSLIFGAAGMAFFIIGGQHLFNLGILCYFLYIIFDCVDGNIARVTNTATYYGKFIDGAIGGLIETLLPFSIGAGLYFASHDVLYLFGGAATALIFSFALVVINRAAFVNRWIKAETKGRRKDPLTVNPMQSKTFQIKKTGNALRDIKILTLLAATLIGMSKPLFTVFLMSILLWALVLTAVTMIDAAGRLNVHRISKWDARLNKKDKDIKKA